MTIIEAIKSGNRFRRPHWAKEAWEDPNKEPGAYFAYIEITADDWEVEEKKVEITESAFRDAFHNALSIDKYFGPTSLEFIVKALGFK